MEKTISILEQTKYSGRVTYSNLSQFQWNELEEIYTLLLEITGSWRNFELYYSFKDIKKGFKKDDFIREIQSIIRRLEQKSTIEKIPEEKRRNLSQRRLMKDLKELRETPLQNVTALPVEGSIFEWHCNVFAPVTSKYYGICMHVEIHFSEKYPLLPPKIILSTELHHVRMIKDANGEPEFCMGFLNNSNLEDRYSQWSTSYSVVSILLQLQSALFEDEHKHSIKEIRSDIARSLKFKCKKCGHDVFGKKISPWNWSEEKKEVFLKNSLFYKGKKFLLKSIKELELEKRRIAKEKYEKDVQKAWGKKKTFIPEIYKTEEYIEIENNIYELDRRRKLMNPKNRKKAGKKIRNLRSRLRELEKNLIVKIQEDKKREEEEIEKGEETGNIEEKEKIEKEKVYIPPEIILLIFSFLQQKDIFLMGNVSDEWYSLSIHPSLHEKKIIKCFYSKRTYEEDIIGFGILVQKGKTGSPSKVTTPLDYISYTSFEEENVRHSAWNDVFSHFLPLFIDEKHWKLAEPIFEKLIIEIYKLEKFHPVYAVDLCSKLMNSMVVDIMEGKIHASERAIQGYAYFHRILLHYITKNQSLRDQIVSKVKNFIKNTQMRHKTVIHNLGEFLPLVSCSGYDWNNVKEAIIEEAFKRNSFWIQRKSNVNIHYLRIKDFSKLEKKIFKSVLVSLKLIAFHKLFLTGVVPSTVNKKKAKLINMLKEIEEIYDESLGRAPSAMVKLLQKNMKLQLLNFNHFFKVVEFKVPNADVFIFLKEEWNNAFKDGYFQKTEIQSNIILETRKKDGGKPKDGKKKLRKVGGLTDYDAYKKWYEEEGKFKKKKSRRGRKRR